MPHKLHKQVKIKTDTDTVVILKKINSISINYDISNLTDSCIISFVKKDVVIKDNTLIYNSFVIKEGDRVDILFDLQFNVKIYTEIETNHFTGYIRSIVVEGNNVIITVDDSMWLLKQDYINISVLSSELHSLINASFLKAGIAPLFDGDFEESFDAIELSNFKTNGFKTIAGMLDLIKSDYGLSFYFVNIDNKPTLRAGLKYPITDDSWAKKYHFAFPYNEGKYGVIEHNLDNFKIDKTRDLVVVGIAVQNDAKARKVAYGYYDKDTPEFFYPKRTKKKSTIPYSKVSLQEVLKSKKFKDELKFPGLNYPALKDLVKNKFDNTQSSGLKGSFTTFAKPVLRVGDIITMQLDDENLDEYYVDKVDIIIDSSTFSQIITIGNKVI